MKRLGSTSSNAAPSTSSSTELVDHNGKDKNHQITPIGKLIVVIVVFAVCSVFLLPFVKLILGDTGRSASATTPAKSNTQQQTLQIPPCPSSPWKENENLQGKCPGDLKPYPDATTISQCASTCCVNADCVSWQFREDIGCIQGGDIRIGQEKDGVSAWCSDHPPYKWKGAYLKVHKDKHKGMKDSEVKEKGCNIETWDPDEEIGQCFGLGDVKKNASGSAEECMQACCKDDKCNAWQYNKELGCFYSQGMHGCTGENQSPVAFDPFVGRRKFRKERTYTDKHNKPWQMTLTTTE